MKNVLVPMDGSSCSMRALDYAIARSGRDTTLHLLNVAQPRDDYGMVRAYVTKQRYRKMIQERAARSLLSATRRARKAGVRVKAHAVIGEVAPTIVSMARRLKCEGIIMGTHGTGGLTGLVMGSVANKVVHLSKIPVTLVK